MLIHRIAVACTISALLAACSTTMPATQTGFLTSYQELAVGPNASIARRGASVPIDPSRLTVGEVEWEPTSADGISIEDRATLVAALRIQLQQMSQTLPTPTNGRAAVLRASITRVETVSPTFNVASTLLLFAPLDRGGAAVEIEAVDSQTGEQLAAMSFGHFAPLSQLKARFSRLAPAELALQRAVSEFAPLLRTSEARTAARDL